MASQSENTLSIFTDLYIVLGEAEYKLEQADYSGALQLYQDILTLKEITNEITDYCVNSIAFIFIELSEYQKAIELVTNNNKSNIKSIKIDSNYILAKAHLYNNELSDSLELLNIVVENWHELKYQSKLALSLDHLLCMSADILLAFNDYESSSQIFKTALSVNPNSSEAYLGLGLICKLSNELIQAKEMFEKSLELDEYNANARLELEELMQNINS